jgi:hypothetical protein
MAFVRTPDEAAQELLQLANARFPQLSGAEGELLRAAASGDMAVCGPISNADDPSYDPARADEWGPERQVQAELIRWLCRDRAAASMVDPAGIQVLGVRIAGPLNLSFLNVPFPIRLFRCRLAKLLLQLLKPWREVVTPHKDVASGRYQQAEFAADLWQVYLGEGTDEYKKPVEFFR